MRQALVATVLMLGTVWPAAAPAVEPSEILADPKLEQRAREISLGLRCLVCQNQSIDDSNAPLAKDLRVLVRERLVAGDSDAEVIDFVVDRYGEFVLLKPRFGLHTLVLWLTAPLLLIGAGIGIYLSYRRRSRGQAAPGALSAAEEKRLQDIMQDG